MYCVLDFFSVPLHEQRGQSTCGMHQYFRPNMYMKGRCTCLTRLLSTTDRLLSGNLLADGTAHAAQAMSYRAAVNCAGRNFKGVST